MNETIAEVVHRHVSSVSCTSILVGVVVFASLLTLFVCLICLNVGGVLDCFFIAYRRRELLRRTAGEISEVSKPLIASSARPPGSVSIPIGQLARSPIRVISPVAIARFSSPQPPVTGTGKYQSSRLFGNSKQ